MTPNEFRVASLTSQVHKVLLNKARRDGSPLDRESTMEELRMRFGMDALSELAWGDMFMMDMMFFRTGGDYKLCEYGWPQIDDVVVVGGVQHTVYDAGLFTFHAEPLSL